MASPSILTPEQDIALRDYCERLLRDRKLPIKLTPLLMGTGGCGKRSVGYRLTWKEYSSEYDPTGPYPMLQRIQIHRGVIDLEYLPTLEYIEDRNDRERLLQCYLKSSDILILVYSVTSRWSMKHLINIREKYFSAIDSATVTGEEKVSGNRELVQGKPIWVLANKIDLPAELWQVSAEEGQEFAESIGARFRSVSALTGEGLQDDFAVEMVSRLLLERSEKAEKEAREEEEKKRKQEAEAASKKKWGRWPFGAKLREKVYARREAKQNASIDTA